MNRIFERAALFLEQYGGVLVLLIFLLINLAGACAGLWDKRRSRLPRGSVRRVPERCFVRFALFGGGTGVLLAMLLVRHKTRSHNQLLLFLRFYGRRYGFFCCRRKCILSEKHIVWLDEERRLRRSALFIFLAADGSFNKSKYYLTQF